MLWTALIVTLAGCAGTPTDAGTGTAVVDPGIDAVPAERLGETWIVGLASEAALGPFAAEAGWVSLVMKRDYAAAVRQLGQSPGLPAARAHEEVAALFREASLAMAFSLVEVYGKTPQPSDPKGVQHLLAVSYAITGDLEAARKASALVPADDPTAPWHAPWAAWLAAEKPVWPPDLSKLPVQLPAVAVGEWPEPTDLPHYSLPELVGSSHRDMGDPGLLVALALWHEAAAEKAAPEQFALVKTIRAGYRLPIEPPVAAAGPLPLELLFGSDHLVPGDAAFLADLHGPAKVGAVDAHAATSLLAELAKRSRGENGKIDAQKTVDLVTRLREDLVKQAAAATNGEVQSHQRIFADIAYTGALRSLALVAEIEGDREQSGLLRINALEHSDKHTGCPVGMLALAAWDASNRYPMRAQDIIHAQSRRYPSLDIARYGLDVLGLRVNSERVEPGGM